MMRAETTVCVAKGLGQLHSHWDADHRLVPVRRQQKLLGLERACLAS